ncbi:helix-turn-helix domain-containing protein [Vibrio harveyi]|uniref:helix-turn-helix domain-containing protein n=1 Tax=Vibrio harveyi TaxID=669 RepID=UPI0006828A57|nr:helix-turn-helix domain-containing protein [Vibrio harveyi]PNM43647.1 hypothetical protein AL469_027750 [Vibrio harveyi]
MKLDIKRPKMGRPPKYTNEFVDEVKRLVFEEKYTRNSVCKQLKLPPQTLRAMLADKYVTIDMWSNDEVHEK